MNERIRELYQQAHSIRRYDGDPALDGNPPTVYWQGEVSAQRFAELIVRECIKEIGYKSAELLDIDMYSHYQERLKKHFGVSE